MRLENTSGQRSPFNPRPLGVFSRTLGGWGGRILLPLPNSRTNRRSQAGDVVFVSSEREDSNAY